MPTTPTIELIHCHGSVRQYKPQPVSAELVETIVAAAQRSSTSSNLQTLSRGGRGVWMDGAFGATGLTSAAYRLAPGPEPPGI